MEIALNKIDFLFNQVKPDVIFTIYTATFGDCLGHMFAKSLGIKSLDIRLSRVKNYIMAVDGINEPPPHILDKYQTSKPGSNASLTAEAEEYVSSVIDNKEMYESLVQAYDKIDKKKSLLKSLKKIIFPDLIRLFLYSIVKFINEKKTLSKYDYQESGYLIPYIYKNIINPFNQKFIRHKIKKHIIGGDDLKTHNYILYPLHTEPELVLSQFARPYLNQIEIVRNISLSMPSGMSLFVKEHPLMKGRRSLGYYKALLSIPNVKLIEFKLPSNIALKHAKLVVIIRGAIGLETVLNKKPVIGLGKSLFDLLPQNMFRTCHNLYDLPDSIFDMLSNYTYDHNAVIKYLVSVMDGSVKANLISDLLGKSGRYRTEVDSENKRFEQHPHLDSLANYLIERIAG